MGLTTTTIGSYPKPVKITMPGPMTIIDSTVDAHYRDDRALAEALANALNHDVRSLAAAGCRHIQIDEPVFARQAEEGSVSGRKVWRPFPGATECHRSSLLECLLPQFEVVGLSFLELYAD